jgi:endonuclease/exonuclease/phosphatase (EEP) superfamily protein YafD
MSGADRRKCEDFLVTGLALAGIALIGTLCGAAARRFWVADLMAHFRVQYAALALAGAVVLAGAGDVLWAAAALLIAAFQALRCAPHLMARRPAPLEPSASVGLRIAAINIWYRNRQFERVVQFVGRERPDVILFAEVTAAWEQALAPLQQSYPHRFATRGARGKGLLLLSRWPMQAKLVPGFSDDEPAVGATLMRGERHVELLSVHTSWPLGGRCAAARDRQLQRIGDFARAQSGPFIVLGDLNVSPFSPHFQTLLAEGTLRSAAQGFGWQPTWPTMLPAVGIQIDHALVGAGVLVTEFRRGTRVGSDHWPIIIECSV